MLIEGPFLKMSEILVEYDNPEGLYEANIANLFAMGIILELNARNVDNPLRKIQMEKRYNNNINTRCDMYLDFTEFISEKYLKTYGMFQRNWVELKYFGGLKRNSGNQAKSEKAGSIIYDIFRLIKNTHINNNCGSGKFSINVFNHRPESYLAFSRQDGTSREWLKELLLSPGVNNLVFDLGKELATIRNLFKDDAADGKNIKMELKVKTTCFEPLESGSEQEETPKFWGYLIQVVGYDLSIGEEVYRYKISDRRTFNG